MATGKSRVTEKAPSPSPGDIVPPLCQCRCQWSICNTVGFRHSPWHVRHSWDSQVGDPEDPRDRQLAQSWYRQGINECEFGGRAVPSLSPFSFFPKTVRGEMPRVECDLCCSTTSNRTQSRSEKQIKSLLGLFDCRVCSPRWVASDSVPEQVFQPFEIRMGEEESLELRVLSLKRGMWRHLVLWLLPFLGDKGTHTQLKPLDRAPREASGSEGAIQRRPHNALPGSLGAMCLLREKSQGGTPGRGDMGWGEACTLSSLSSGSHQSRFLKASGIPEEGDTLGSSNKGAGRVSGQEKEQVQGGKSEP